MTPQCDAIGFSIPQYEYMFPSLCAATGMEAGQLEVRRFPDGERYMRIATSVTDREVVLLGGTINDEATLSLYDLGCALVKYGARRLTMVIPYFGYATMERATRRGEVVVAKTRARLLSSIPPASHGNRVILLDLHSDGIPHYFEGGITAQHAYARQAVLQAARQAGGPDFVLAATDAGRAKWVQALGNVLGLDVGLILKRRLSPEQTEVSAVSAPVGGRAVVIYDDMIRSGSSLIEAARAYREAGAASISAVATHGALVPGALRRLRESGLFGRIITTDSHPRAVELADDGLEVVSVIPCLVPLLSPS